MNFVTKKEFDAAVATLKRAVKNEQIIDRCNELPQDCFGFGYRIGSSLEYFKTFDSVSFISPDIAAKNHLHSLREKLKISRKHKSTHEKEIEQLESEERNLAALIPTLKEE